MASILQRASVPRQEGRRNSKQTPRTAAPSPGGPAGLAITLLMTAKLIDTGAAAGPRCATDGVDYGGDPGSLSQPFVGRWPPRPPWGLSKL